MKLQKQSGSESSLIWFISFTMQGIRIVILCQIISRKNGKRIDLHLFGVQKSEPARKEIEETFVLVKAEGRKIKEQFLYSQLANRKIEYGKAESKKAITWSFKQGIT